jgi:hypothetical protein
MIWRAVFWTAIPRGPRQFAIVGQRYLLACA